MFHVIFKGLSSDESLLRTAWITNLRVSEDRYSRYFVFFTTTPVEKLTL